MASTSVQGPGSEREAPSSWRRVGKLPGTEPKQFLMCEGMIRDMRASNASRCASRARLLPLQRAHKTRSPLRRGLGKVGVPRR